MAEFERGDIVVYVFPEASQWHGTLAVVDYCEATPKIVDPCGLAYPVHIHSYLITAPGFPYADVCNGVGGPWVLAAWEKVGHLDGF